MFPFSSFNFKPESDVPSLSGKVIIITGANSGLGYESLIQLAKHSPERIYLCARSKEKYDAAMEGISSRVTDAPKFVRYLELDLQSLAAVKKSAQTFLADNDRLDVLMNNAGIMAQPPALTKDGYEAQFGTNHMGHALFTKELLHILQKTAKEPNSDVRIVNLSSDGHRFARSADFVSDELKTDMVTYSTWTRYGYSKLANILFTRELAKRYPDITSVAIHPGAVATNLATSFMGNHPYLAMAMKVLFPIFAATASTGAYNQTWATTAPVAGKAWTVRDGVPTKREVENGAYYTPVANKSVGSTLASDPALAEKLWEWTESELEGKGY